MATTTITMEKKPKKVTRIQLGDQYDRWKRLKDKTKRLVVAGGWSTLFQDARFGTRALSG